MLPIFLALTLTFSSATELPDSQNTNDTGSVFTQGLETFKARDYTKSRELFRGLLAKNPNDKVLLYNLGLVEFSDNQFGAAAGYWRRALWLSPGFSAALDGLLELQKKLSSVDDSSGLSALYLRCPPWVFLTLSLVLLFGGGWLLLQNLQQKKAGNEPRRVYLTGMALLFGLCVMAVNVHYFFFYSQERRATILKSDTPLFASPSSSAPSLVNLSEGANVFVLREHVSATEPKEEWVQVQKSSVQVGWVPKAQIFIHTE